MIILNEGIGIPSLYTMNEHSIYVGHMISRIEICVIEKSLKNSAGVRKGA
jgi:hypothetical protein